MSDDIDWLAWSSEPSKDGEITEQPPSEMLEDDEWEDGDFEASIYKKYPGWYLVKLEEFTEQRFKEVKPWLESNVRYGAYKKVGWDSGCSYSIGVVFQSPKDAMVFKLRWR